ncbi:beta/gamma crystallin domain-containing protein [Ramlibacter sp.]|uniref:beta/gamma crystallin domain-containing protein n=1 Tax=Ramlibacter sp. TaxID=1917967 RepID=UPI002D5CC84D|nr:beta/gamma crystallin domain-containing protein [Ramlibacter sp.]HYD76495.1 beta/gamma crystallin domain-containing protein [Ramlibacter sp.]
MQFKKKTVLALVAACAVAGGTATAQSGNDKPGASGGTVVSRQAIPTQAMQRLQDSADRLRQSIQALAQKPPGPERERAISNAHDALLRTQQAMMALPPDMRVAGMTSTADYDKSVKQLMKSADSLRQSIQEMAQQPAGERRNEAIQQAHRALWETQAAMIDAYQPSNAAQAMGAPGQTGSSGGSGTAAAGSQEEPRQKERQASSGSGATQAAPAAVLVLLPAEQAQGQRLADGCWVRFFDDKGFKGDTLTLAGPVDLPRMELGDAWRDWDSAVVGPKATVRTFDNENFRDRTAVLDAGQSIPDLGDRKLGWFEEVKSARVSCA